MEIGATSTEKGMHMSARERERERETYAGHVSLAASADSDLCIVWCPWALDGL